MTFPTQYILPTITVLFVFFTIRHLSNQSTEGFRAIGVDLDGNPIEPTETRSIPKLPHVPDAYTLSQRHQIVHLTDMSCMEQISNHRRPDEYATMDNGTAKPFEMSSEFFHPCDTNRVIPRKLDFTVPAEHTPNHLRVGAFSYQS